MTQPSKEEAVVPALRSHPQAPASGEYSTLHITEADKEFAREISEDLDEPDGWSREQLLSQWIRKIRHEAYLALSPSQPASGEGKLREALEFYANEQNYRWDWVPMTPYVDGNPDDAKPKEDRGAIAREALSTPPSAIEPGIETPASNCERHAPLAEGQEAEAWRLIQEIRDAGGNGVTVALDEIQPDDSRLFRVSVCAEWTCWNDNDYTGESLLGAAKNAHAFMSRALTSEGKS